MIEVGNLMVKKEYVLHIVDKLKCGIKSEIKKKNYEAALELILNCANILYQTNLYYVDEDLEGYLKQNGDIISHRKKNRCYFFL